MPRTAHDGLTHSKRQNYRQGRETKYKCELWQAELIFTTDNFVGRLLVKGLKGRNNVLR